MQYDLELDKIVKEINKNKAKLVCIQLPDGLKQEATKIADYIQENTKATCLIWADSCFGSCDLPVGLEKLKIDMLIHFGHEKFIGGKNGRRK